MALAYTAPTWVNGSGTGISASQLQALSDCMEGLVQGSDKAITNIAISGQTITLTFADGSQESGTASGLKGISSIAKTGTSGNVDTYTITYTDGSTSTFTVTNGTTGPAGPTGPQGPQGIQGPAGDDGVSPGVTITTITGGHRVNITDAEHPQGQSFDVMDGAGSGDMQAATYDPNSDVASAGGIADYVENAIAENVVANPTGTATGTLTKLGIGSDIYDIQGGSGADYVELTQAQYDALTPAQKNNGKMYFITDGVNNGSKRIVVVTDSYGEVTNNFISYMRSMCPKLNNSNFFPFAYSSAGFVGDLVSGQHISWKQRFIDSGDINTVPEPSTITDVLILGGSNDRGNGITVSDIMSAAQTFYGLVSNVFTNANIYVGYIGYSVNYLAGDAVLSTKRAYQSLGVYGYRPIAHANSWLHYTGYITDNVHPNADGSKLIATGVLNTIFGGGTDDIFNHEPTPVGLTFETGFSSVSQASTDRWVIYHYGHRSGIKVLGEFAFATAVVRCNSSYTKFATIGDTYIYGANDNVHICNCFINVGINSKNYTLPCVVKLFNKGLYIKFPPHEELPSASSYNVTYATLYFGGIEADDIFM